jgi:hypothetical protein
MFLKSNASSITINISTPLPIETDIRQPLNPQPIVKVLDEAGQPMKGATIVAFSWPEANFDGT